METRRRTWFDERGLVVATPGGERALPFYSGTMHYWRLPPARWAACLRAMHQLGLTIVETYVPWRVHEPSAGSKIWSGAADLARFLDAARAAGLAVVLRPGPHCNAEMTSFGMPDWVLGEPACQAVTARGTPAWLPAPPRAFPIPSYASARFHEHVRAWYAAVAEIVRPHLAPDGPVVAIGVDNEAQLYFRTGAYDLDYHPAAIAWWREAGGEGEPPREWSAAEAGKCAQWVAFKDEYIARALGDFAGMLVEVGLGEIARFHNFPPGHHGGYDVRRLQRTIAGPVGIDAYTARDDFADLRARAAAVVGDGVPLPLALEVGVGFFPWFPPLDRDDRDTLRERDHVLTLLAAGVRGFNLYMAVERDRWYGAAIDQHGRIEPHAKWITQLLAVLAELEWPALRRAKTIAIVAAKADTRFGTASNAVDPMSTALADALGLGPGGAAELGDDRGAIEARRWQTALVRACDLAQVPYEIVGEGASEDELAHYRAVVTPMTDRVDPALWAKLRALAEAKRTVVVVGPGVPTRDAFDRPVELAASKRMGKLRADSLADREGLASLAEDLAALAGDGAADWQIERPDDVRAAAFADAGGSVRAVFVTSDVPRAVTAVLLAGAGVAALRDPFTREVLRVTDGRATVAMHARGVRMFVVEATA